LIYLEISNKTVTKNSSDIQGANSQVVPKVAKKMK